MVVALVVALALAMTGCTSGRHPAGDTSSARPSSSSPAVLQPTVRASGKAVTVVDGHDPVTLMVRLSKALFTSAPVIVLAGAGDSAGIETAAAQAGRLGVPLLLVDGPDATPAPATPAPTAPTTPAPTARGATASPSPAAELPAQLSVRLAGEIERLGARTVLAVGAGLSERAGRLAHVDVVTDPARLPAVSPADGGGAVAVLVRSGGTADDASTAAAAGATAMAAGARVIAVAGDDPRADPDAIEALSKEPPDRVVAVGASFGPVQRLAARLRVVETGVELPAGGQVFFPGHRLVALYGHPGTAALGVLGEQGLSASIARAKKMAADYEPLSRVPVVPTFEIIATVAQGSAGPDGDFSGESSVAELRPWVEKAGAAGVYVVLDLQPGRANFLDQAKRYAALLRLPHVGLALDPEWRLGPGQRPLGQIGGVDASEVNSVISWLADLTAKNRLPQKLLVLHQFRLSMLRDEDDLDTGSDEVQLLIHMDGQGTPAMKDSTWEAVTHAAPKGVPFGWKNFCDEDHPMLSPAQTMTKRPAPVMISYQ